MSTRDILINLAVDPSELAGTARIPSGDPLHNWSRNQLRDALELGFPHAHPAHVPHDASPEHYRRLAPGVHLHAAASADAAAAAERIVADIARSAAEEESFWRDAQ